MVKKSILSKFLFVLAPIYLTLVLIGSLIAAQVLIRDNTDELAARVGSLAARVSMALDMHEAYYYSALASDLIAPLGVDPAIVCVEFKGTNSDQNITAHPPQIGCTGQQDAPFYSEIAVDDYGEYQLLIRFTDAEITAAVTKQALITAGILTLAFIITLISAAIGFRTIVSSRLLALHGAIKMAADNLKRQKVKSSGQDELTEIINAYNSLMDRDDVRERQLTAANEILSIQSRQDPLTGLYNRRFFNSLVKKEMTISTTPDAPGAMLLLDIDHFKKVNDNYGHSAGDEVLIETARRLENCLPEGTPIVRWGGEEFLIYLKNLNHSEVNSFTAMLLNSIGTRPASTKSGDIPVTVSIGTVRIPFTCGGALLKPEEVVNIADRALYRAKSGGRNCAVVVAEQELPDDHLRKSVESDFNHAITNGLIHIEVIEGPGSSFGELMLKAA